MKVGYWWVKSGLLTSGDDPTQEVSNAADQFGDDYDPMVFMTGDGHREPPFKWTDRGAFAGFFDEIVNINKICCHVEEYQDKVSVNSVPGNLAAVFYNKKVFGWEPEFYKTIQNVLESIPTMLLAVKDKEDVAVSAVKALTKGMCDVHNLGYMQNEGKKALQYWKLADSLSKGSSWKLWDMDDKKTIPSTELPDFYTFLKNYATAGIQLRVGINDVIGKNIQKVIDTHPDHMHLITCGDAHIIHNPLYKHVKPPVGTFGIVDQCKN